MRQYIRPVLLLGVALFIVGGCINSIITSRDRKRPEPAEPKAGEGTARGAPDAARSADKAKGKDASDDRSRDDEKWAQLEAMLKVNKQSLRRARETHRTKLLNKGPSLQPHSDVLPAGVTRVTYKSEGRELLAWLARPKGKGPFPAVLYAHGGFALGKADFDDAKPFLDANFIVLLPAWRGENGNPGHFVMYYGEVDDALAALDYLEQVPGVDPDRLYAAGHSAGGTLVMLLAELSLRLRKAAASGGFPDTHAYVLVRKKPPFPQTPFDWHDLAESDLRSPRRYVKDLQCPLALYNGQEDTVYVAQAQLMQQEAKKLGRTLLVETIPNTDHFSALAPSVRKMIDFFCAP